MGLLENEWIFSFYRYCQILSCSLLKFKRKCHFGAHQGVPVSGSSSFLGTFRIVGHHSCDWENNCYRQHLHMIKDAFSDWTNYMTHSWNASLVRLHIYGNINKKVGDGDPLLIPRRNLCTYSVGRSTASTVVHSSINFLAKHLVPKSIYFREGSELLAMTL